MVEHEITVEQTMFWWSHHTIFINMNMERKPAELKLSYTRRNLKNKLRVNFDLKFHPSICLTEEVSWLNAYLVIQGLESCTGLTNLCNFFKFEGL